MHLDQIRDAFPGSFPLKVSFITCQVASALILNGGHKLILQLQVTSAGDISK